MAHEEPSLPIIIFQRALNIEISEHHIYCAGFGKWETNPEYGEYYLFHDLNIWVDVIVNKLSSQHEVGIRWTTDHWAHHQDSHAYFIKQTSENQELWRVEILNFAKTGWRDGRYGGPDGEQPSSSIWNLWGLAGDRIKCLPSGKNVPDFEFAIFLKEEGKVSWDNNFNENYRISFYCQRIQQ